MESDVTVIWKKGDGEMPEKAKNVVDGAKSELLLQALQLPEDIVNTIKYNSEKNKQSVCHYVSDIVVEQLRIA
jgi:type II secretory pathway component PulC